MLGPFIAFNRGDVVARCVARIESSALSGSDQARLSIGPFLDELVAALDGAGADPGSRRSGAEPLSGCTPAQVVRHYGGLCESITDLAIERRADVSIHDFMILHRFLTATLASAVAACQRDQLGADRDAAKSNLQLGYFAHEVRNLLNTAILSYEVLKGQRAGVSGRTERALHSSLLGLRALVLDSLARVRPARRSAIQPPFSLAPFIDELSDAASLLARETGVTFVALPVQHGLALEVDRPIIAAAVTNLLQNAVKFTRPGTTVTLRTRISADRVLIEVEDECGGLPGRPDDLFIPFEQRGADRSGLGLGLAYSRQGVEGCGGRIHARSLPGRGCIFTIDLARAARPAAIEALVRPGIRALAHWRAEGVRPTAVSYANRAQDSIADGQ